MYSKQQSLIMQHLARLRYQGHQQQKLTQPSARQCSQQQHRIQQERNGH